MIGYSGITKVISVDINVTGDVPDRPFILASNHLSYLDIPVYGSVLGAVFVSKSEIESWPIIGLVARIFRNIFVNRQEIARIPQVNERIYNSYLDGDAIVIFPEGTTSKGDKTRHFKSSLLNFAAKKGLPVHYAYLNYQTKGNYPCAEEVVHWAGQVSVFEYLTRLLSLPKIYANVDIGDEPIYSSNRKRLAGKLEESIT